MATVAERLDRALEHSGMTLHALHTKLKGVPGCSYANMHAYQKGSTPPSLEFLTEAAKVMKVRAPWLAFEDGPMTDSEQEAELHASWSELSTSYEGPVHPLEPALLMVEDRLDGIRAGMGAFGGGESPAVRYTLLEALERLRRHEGEGDGPGQATRLGRAVVAPLVALGIEPGDVSTLPLRDYLISVAGALMRVMRAPGDGHHINRPTED